VVARKISHHMRAAVLLFFSFLFTGRLLPASGVDVPANVSVRPATPEESALLLNVLHKTADDLARWAYIEHRVVKTEKGKVKSQQVVRYDPSLPSIARAFAGAEKRRIPPARRCGTIAGRALPSVR